MSKAITLSEITSQTNQGQGGGDGWYNRGRAPVRTMDSALGGRAPPNYNNRARLNELFVNFESAIHRQDTADVYAIHDEVMQLEGVSVQVRQAVAAARTITFPDVLTTPSDHKDSKSCLSFLSHVKSRTDHVTLILELVWENAPAVFCMLRVFPELANTPERGRSCTSFECVIFEFELS